MEDVLPLGEISPEVPFIASSSRNVQFSKDWIFINNPKLKKNKGNLSKEKL